MTFSKRIIDRISTSSRRVTETVPNTQSDYNRLRIFILLIMFLDLVISSYVAITLLLFNFVILRVYVSVEWVLLVRIL